MAESADGRLKFGTAPVFLTAISTILGAIMFLRFGYAVGSVGFAGTIAIILIGHLVTIPTAMALAEIATNQKVEGGGEYFIISRSFGLTIGASIGIALYFSQAISVAFYVIAFAQAFDPVTDYIAQSFNITLEDKRWFSIPAMGLLSLLMLTRGASIGIKALYLVVAVLAASLIMFFAGKTGYTSAFTVENIADTIAVHDDFFYVFAICFPAFTGMTAGVGLSGDLLKPKKSIPLGTLSATISGMVIYFFIAYKLASSAAPEDLVSDQLIMSKIAIWGPIIPIGLACATISSALGSIMVAPRTLQAIGQDRITPFQKVNYWLSRGKSKTNEPRNATIVTCIIAFLFVLIGDVNFVAEIISMFFMVTYGTICLISFLQHFAADPSYRPAFRSRWYVSLLGALMCIWLMFKMNAPYALLAVIIMTLLYIVIKRQQKEASSMALIFQGVIFQLSRRLQVFLQKANKESTEDQWRPSVVCVSRDSFSRFAAFNILRWISWRYGFGTYIHLIEGYLNSETHQQATESRERLIRLAGQSRSSVYIDTLISPSFTSAIAQIVQLPGISGKENNLILFEFAKDDPEGLDRIIDNYPLIRSVDFDICTLGSSTRGFGFRKEIHIWINVEDYKNANLMILLGYIIIGHPDWRHAQIKLFALLSETQKESHQEKLTTMIREGRLPISPNNIRVISDKKISDDKTLINQYSVEADLTITGLSEKHVANPDTEMYKGFDKIGNILFVHSMKQKKIQ